MEKKVKEYMRELRTIVDRIDLNYTGLESVFRRKKYAKLKFVHRMEDIVVAQQEIIEQSETEIKQCRQQLEKLIVDTERMRRQYEEQIKGLLGYKEENEKYKEENEKHKAQMKKQSGATARQLMKIKWHLIDEEAKYKEKPEDILHCKICGYEAERKSFSTKETECRFNGGKLVRYICPECGVIFGPTKFSALTQDEINDDYTAHYVGFYEGDSTQKELAAFYMLKPDKNKIYLNFGCGSWSKSLEDLRQQGYQVFGYEPYAPETDNPYIITNIETIQKMRFDGIFSNDLIEHLVHPVEDFIFMKGLLKDRSSKMSHSTSCYIYKHEVTRFHTHFFTGQSIEVLCEKAGLQIVECVNEVDTKDFICYVYKPMELNTDYTDKLCGVKKEGNVYVLEQDGTMYGPYLTVGGGHYRWLLQLGGIPEAVGGMDCRITEQSGKETLKTVKVSNGDNIIELDINQIVVNLEFVIDNKTKEKIKIEKLQMLGEIM